MTRTLTTGELRGGRGGETLCEPELGEMSDGGGPGRAGALTGLEATLEGLDGDSNSDSPSADGVSCAAVTRSVVVVAAGLSSGQFTFRMGERGGSGMLGKGSG